MAHRPEACQRRGRLVASGKSMARREFQDRHSTEFDRMQRRYVYWRTEPVGRNFAPGFTPDLTPKEMLR